MYSSEDALELGVGKFRRARTPSRNSYDGAFIILPAYGKRNAKQKDRGDYPGGLEILMDLRRKHMQILQADPEWRRYVTWHSRRFQAAVASEIQESITRYSELVHLKPANSSATIFVRE
jgi:hypothetical protein